MRFIKRVIMFLFILVIGLPIALIGLALIDDIKQPNYLTKADAAAYADVEKVLLADFDKVMVQFLAGNKSIKVDEIKTNKMIYGYFGAFDKDTASNKLPENIEGIWTDVSDDHLTMYIKVSYWKFSTTLTAKVKIITTDDSVKLTLTNFKIGKLPIPKALFTTILSNLELDKEFSQGEVNYDDLSISILKSEIQSQLEKAMDNNLIVFSSLVLDEDEFIINCEFNTNANSDAQVISDTIDEFKNIVQNDVLISNVSNNLDYQNLTPAEVEKVEDFKETLTEFNTLMKEKINNPLDITESDIALLTQLQISYQDIPKSQQEAVVEAFENSIDPQLLSNITTTLNNLNISGFENISDLLLGNNSQ